MDERLFKRRIMRDLVGVPACRVETRAVVGFPDIVYVSTGPKSCVHMVECKVCDLDGDVARLREPLKAEQCYWLQVFADGGCRTAFVIGAAVRGQWATVLVLPAHRLTAEHINSSKVNLRGCFAYDLRKRSVTEILVGGSEVWSNTQVGGLPTNN